MAELGCLTGLVDLNVSNNKVMNQSQKIHSKDYKNSRSMAITEIEASCCFI